MEIKGTFCFDPSDRIYEDHFPGNPVVPGSVIISAFLEAIKETGVIDKKHLIKDFRFRAFVTPGEHAFSIEDVNDGMKCRLFQSSSDESKLLATGLITI